MAAPAKPPLEKLGLSGLDFESFNRLLGQRTDDLVNIAAIRAGRSNSQTGRVRQHNPKRPAVSNAQFRCRHHVCPRHRITIRLPARGPSPGCPGSSSQSRDRPDL
jgi:hypothetical protein